MKRNLKNLKNQPNSNAFKYKKEAWEVNGLTQNARETWAMEPKVWTLIPYISRKSVTILEHLVCVKHGAALLLR